MPSPRLILALLCGVAVAALARTPDSFATVLDLARAGDAIVAVGERGLVLRSIDEGLTWSEIPAATSATLTSVTFLDASRGFACGHDGRLLSSEDGGLTWAERKGVLAAGSSPLCIRGSNTQIVIGGAFGQLLSSIDGGQTWSTLPTPDGGPHIYALAARGESWAFAGEMGFIGYWAFGEPLSIEAPGAPSLHGLIRLSDGTLLAYGIRGHVRRLAVDGDDWEPVSTPRTELLAAGTETAEGNVILAGQAGYWLGSKDHGRSFTLLSPPQDVSGIAALLPTKDGALLCAGEKGVRRIPIPAPLQP